MSPVEVIAAFATAPQGRFPVEAIAAAEAQREAVIPLLRAALEDAFDLAEDDMLDLDGDWRLPNFAFYLLARWKVPGIHEQLVRVLTLDEEDIALLISDALTEEWASLLVATFAGDWQPLQSIVTDAELYDFARSTALRAIATLVHDGRIDANEAQSWFRSLFTSLPRQSNYVWPTLVEVVSALQMGDLLPEIREVFRANMVSPFFLKLADAEAILRGESLGWETFAEPLEDALTPLRKLPYFTLSAEDWKEQFARESPDEDVYRDDISPLPPTPEWQLGAAEYIPAPKIGRNDPCPCGSGKKHKKCCGAIC